MVRRAYVVMCLVVIPFFLTGCGLKKSDTTTSGTKSSPTPTGLIGASSTLTTNQSTYLTVEPASLDSALSERLAEADQKAKIWRNDAQLVHFSAKFGAGYKIDAVTETYSYGSPTEAYDWWTYTISQKTGKKVRALIPREDYLGSTMAVIPKNHWKANYIEAFQLAENNGGSQYRAANPDAQVTASLSVGEPKSFLWWSVEYSSESAEALKILVNPSTKEVTSATGQAIASPAAATSPNSSPKTTPNSVDDSTVIDESSAIEE